MKLRQYALPSGIPDPSWDADTLHRRAGWRFAVPGAIRHDLDRLKEAGSDVIPDEALAPRIWEMAQRTRAALRMGGVVWWKGTDALCPDEQQRLFLALGDALGNSMPHYGRLYKVTDRGGSYTEASIPVSQTSAATGFHTDSTARERMPDTVGLLCIRPAIRGGDTTIVNAVAIHERLRQQHPDLLRALYQEFIRDIVTPGFARDDAALRLNRFPVFTFGVFSSTLTFRYMRYWIESGHRRAGLPLAPIRIEALNALDALLNAPEFQLRFRLTSGDMLLLNNHLIAHNRSAYTNDPASPRMLLRMWLTNRSPTVEDDAPAPENSNHTEPG